MGMQRKRRRRSGGNNNNNNTNPNKHFESNGPDVRIRGSAQQILDKYLQYARDAQTAGDRVKAEALFQHAEHYARIVAVFEKQKEEQRLEREAREQQRAEERAAREAENAAHEAEHAETEATDASEAGAETAEASAEAASTEDAPADKPKRRRRTYARKEESAVEAEDGVMKTLSRGVDVDAESDASA